MPHHTNPSLYQVNTRALLSELGTGSTLRDISDQYIEDIKSKAFDFVWFLGVWQTGVEGPRISRTHPDLQDEYRRALPDLTTEDICGSPFAVYDYSVHSDFGGNSALLELRERYNARGIKFMLDFVPNHMAIDHSWVKESPQLLVRGAPSLCDSNYPNWFKGTNNLGIEEAFAHGRDPYFAGWTDTVQLNYREPELHDAMLSELLRVAELCDGVRCDMAMLLLPHIFSSTWKGFIRPGEPDCFWTKAIQTVKAKHPGFTFMAEVYWGLEHEMLSRGFDFAYDKTLYDRLLHPESAGTHSSYAQSNQAHSLRLHLLAPDDYQSRMARFLENHDEPRVASKLPLDAHKAASVITYFAPGLRFFHMGQFEGKKVKIPVHLARGPSETTNSELSKWYSKLLSVTNETIRNEISWQTIETNPAWEGNQSHEGFVTFSFSTESRHFLCAVNYTPNRGECYIPLKNLNTQAPAVQFTDLLGTERFQRTRDSLCDPGLYLDVGPWNAQLFELEEIK